MSIFVQSAAFVAHYQILPFSLSKVHQLLASSYHGGRNISLAPQPTFQSSAHPFIETQVNDGVTPVVDQPEKVQNDEMHSLK